jgi:group I intron endonuclease
LNNRLAYVYLLTNSVNSKMYVGKAYDPRLRWKSHQKDALKGVKKRLYDAIRCYGSSVFELSILEECSSDQTALDAEKFWIARLNTMDPLCGYNMTPGGDGVSGEIVRISNSNRIITHGHRLKMTKAGRNRVVTDVTRAKISAKTRGRKFSDSHRQAHKIAAERRSTRVRNMKHQAQQKQLVLFVVGPDGCGKSNIIAALKKELQIESFKASDEHATFLSHKQEKFLNDLRFADPRIEDFIYQTGVSVIFDRGYPCEKVYSEFYGRETDHRMLRFIDERYSRINAKILICTRSSYEGRVDNLDSRLDGSALQKIDSLYRDFVTWTKCKTLLLNVDDENLEREISDIKRFLT